MCLPVFCISTLCSKSQRVSCPASSFSLPKHCKALQAGFSCRHALYIFFFYLYSLFRNCHLSHFIFSLEYSRLCIFVMWFCFFSFLSGLIKDCKNLPTALETYCCQKQEDILVTFFSLKPGLSDVKQTWFCFCFFNIFSSSAWSERISSSGAPECVNFPPANCPITFICIALEDQWTWGT